MNAKISYIDLIYKKKIDRWGNLKNIAESRFLDGSLVGHKNDKLSTCGKWENLLNKPTNEFKAKYTQFI